MIVFATASLLSRSTLVSLSVRIIVSPHSALVQFAYLRDRRVMRTCLTVRRGDCQKEVRVRRPPNPGALYRATMSKSRGFPAEHNYCSGSALIRAMRGEICRWTGNGGRTAHPGLRRGVVERRGVAAVRPAHPAFPAGVPHSGQTPETLAARE